MAVSKKPKVFIVGGGFAGLAATKALSKSLAEVAIIDRRNHHVFQPLLYQVATAALSPADISSPIRRILRNQKNCQVVLAKAIAIDTEKKHLIFKDGYAPYDYLVLAAGATHAYFGHDDWSRYAPGLKTLQDATVLRQRILLAFEYAEYEGSVEARRAALTFGIVGAGPTGVELAGAIKEIAGLSIPCDYRNIDTRTTRVILFQSGDRILPQFPPKVSERAHRDLEKMGVEIRLNTRVTDITSKGLSSGNEFISIRNVFWAAGVTGNPLGKTLNVPLDQNGRVIVGKDLSIPNHPEVFVVGDMASALSYDDGKPVPGVAQAGLQMGHYVGSLIAKEISGKSKIEERKPFTYNDKGSIAVIGKSKAVVSIAKIHFGGFPAWLLWAGIHVAFLQGMRNRFNVIAEWILSIAFDSLNARLIVGDANLKIETPRTDEFVLTYKKPDTKLIEQVDLHATPETKNLETPSIANLF